MRRNERKTHDEDLNDKLIKYTGIALVTLVVIVFALFLYSKNLNSQVKEGSLTSKQIASIMNATNTSENVESTSTEIGKSINEVENEAKNNATNNNVITNTINQNTTNQNTINQNSIVKNTTSNTNKTNSTSASATTEEKKEEVILDFDMPVEGEIVKDFASDSLVYSETLQEWTIHNGIDIQAEKTTVIKAAEAGKIKSIKNDPRYGLTVVIEHANGFQTIYSNLLTSEFVVEGEKVEKGQSIGTVGNTASFEIADAPHLHFEMLKDSAYLDPNIYLK